MKSYKEVKLARSRLGFSFFQRVQAGYLLLAILLLFPLQGMAFAAQSMDPISPGIGDGSSTENYVPPKTFTYNFNEINNVQTDVPSLTTELMGDQTDPASGASSWTQTDVSLPGNFALEVAVKRELLDAGSWPRATRELGNWNLAIPHIRSRYITNVDGSFSHTQGSLPPAWVRGEACSAPLNSNPDFYKYIDGAGFELKKEDYWQGDTISIPGVGSEQILQDGTTKKTVNQWKIDCLDVNGVDAFQVTLPDGTAYIFSELKTIKSFKKTYLASEDMPCLQQCAYPALGDNTPNLKLAMSVVNVFMQVTEVKDRFGNWVKYDYDTYGNLIRIYASDGREITLQYSGTDERRLSSVRANNRTWTYSYQSPNTSSESDMYLLTGVTLPDSRQWQFDYPDNGTTTRFWHSLFIGRHAQIDPFDPVQCDPGGGGDYVSMTHPGGASAIFRIEGRCVGQAAVPKLQNFNRFGQGAPYQTYALPKTHQQYSLSHKRLDLPDGTVYEWGYSYNLNFGYYYGESSPYDISFNLPGLPAGTDLSFVSEDLVDVSATLITNPDGNYQLSIADRRYGYQNGKQLYAATYDANFNLVSYTKYHYSVSPMDYGSTRQWVHGIEEYIVYPLPPEFDGQIYFDQAVSASKHMRLLDRELVLVDGATPTSYKEAFSQFNNYEKAQQVSQYGPGGTRQIQLGFAHHSGTWVLNQPTTVDVSLNGGTYQRLSENVYYDALHSNTAYRFQLKEEKYFGTIRKAYPSYQSVTGARGQIKDVDLHLDAAGSKRRVSFNNYKRGQAQTVTVPQRYLSGTMSMTKEVDDNGWVVATTDFNGVRTEYAYTPVGLVRAVNLAPDSTYTYGNWNDTLFTYSYPSSGGLVRTAQQCVVNNAMSGCSGPTSLTTTQTYDALYRLVKRQVSGDGESRYQLFTYDANNQTTFASFVSANSNETRGTHSTYGPLKRKTSVTTSGLGTTYFNYLAGNKVQQVNPRGFATVTTYRAFATPLYHYPTRIESPEGVVTELMYDTFANVTAITQQGGGLSQTESRVYDSHNHLCFVGRNDTGNVQFKYNLLGELQWQAQGNVSSCSGAKPAHAVDRVYDNLGSLKAVNYPDSTPDVSYTLDNVGNLVQLAAGSAVQNYVYNNQGALESETLTVPGRSESLTVDYRYNSDLAPSALVYPVTQQVVHLSPNAFGEPTQVARSGQSYASGIDFHPSGGVKSFTYGNGVTHQSVLDSVSNLPVHISDMKGNNRIAWFDYAYDNNANITQLLDGTDSGYHLNALSYDGLDRLIGTSGNSKAGNASVDYDALGNITRLVTHNRTLNYNYNTTLNRLTGVSSSGTAAKNYSYFNYDARGNITYNSHVGMSYNLANQMTSALGNSYTYDGHNRRVKVAGNGDTRYYFYSQSGQLLFSEENGIQTNYIYLGNKLIAEDSQAVTTFVHSDMLGSPVARTNAAGTVQSRRHYKPFGDTYEAPSYDIGYTGHKYDNDLGLSYMQARYYDPVIGRFYSNDPKGTASFLSEGKIQGFNRYAYAANNPYKYVDPDGRDYEETFLSLKVPFVGAVDVGTVSFKPNANGQGNTTSGLFVRFSTSASNVDSDVTKGAVKQKGAIAGLTFGKGAGSHTDQNFDDPSASIDVGVGVGTVSIGDASSSESSATVEIGPSLGADATVSKSFTLTGNDVKQAAQEVKSKIEELIR
ncbi:RHS repeat domain-containing protein [Idiomarina aquatica]|uniref:RHS repeat-associated protein n=1 Tax=Idiomarina aquatica TaxID=1327752 RepID=A0AA94EGT5_9GAMM|nr:RHS repeat-associated core domain-containing protein [Idiomarina aquatica]RUO45608.1 hypothetical protein CWE23_06355 [Idiomarina aquatica]